MVPLIRYSSALVAVILMAVAPAHAAEQVDLLLVLSADVSRSVDHPKFLLQREGYATAISDPHVIEAIKSGRHQRIAMCFVEWSGFGAQKLVIDWTMIDSPDAARKFGDQLLELPRSFADRTSISGGIEFATALLEHAPYEAAHRIIDVSGDGTNNAGRDVKLARDETIAKGIVINGLVILSDQPMPWNAEHTNPPGGLEKYYQDNVIGGPRAFVMVAENFNSFGRAIIKKLIAEIAFLTPALFRDQWSKVGNQQMHCSGRDAIFIAPPAQNRTSGFPAYGSHLGCMTAIACRMRSSACDTRAWL